MTTIFNISLVLCQILILIFSIMANASLYKRWKDEHQMSKMRAKARIKRTNRKSTGRRAR